MNKITWQIIESGYFNEVTSVDEYERRIGGIRWSEHYPAKSNGYATYILDPMYKLLGIFQTYTAAQSAILKYYSQEAQ